MRGVYIYICFCRTSKYLKEDQISKVFFPAISSKSVMFREAEVVRGRGDSHT